MSKDVKVALIRPCLLLFLNPQKIQAGMTDINVYISGLLSPNKADVNLLRLILS